jgi:shikimate dehydrogenase
VASRPNEELLNLLTTEEEDMTFKISGATRLYGIVGNPIVQVKSPETFTAAFMRDEINAIMLPFHVLPEAFDATVQGLMALGNLDGLIFTVPYKARAIALADRLGKTASCIKAINALRREGDGSWSGDMFDGLGFVVGAQRKGIELTGRKVALFGAGGAGSAIACELLIAGVGSLAIIDPQAQQAETLAEKLRVSFPEREITIASRVPAGANMIVNASTVGMKPGDGLPGEIGTVTSDMVIGDVINTEAKTPIINMAVDKGCSYVMGKDMHAGQGDALLAFFAGAEARR